RMVVLQEERGKGGTERKGIHSRYQYRDSQRKSELTIEYARRTLHEADRNEYRGHHQRDRNDRARYLAHGGYRGFLRRETRGLHLRMHRFHHDDRIIHYDTDRQHEGEQGQQVDR